MRPFPLVLPMLVGLLHASAPSAVEPAALDILEDGKVALLIAEPSIGSPTLAQTALTLPSNAAMQGDTFASARNGFAFAAFLVPAWYRVPLGVPATAPEAGT